MSVPGDDETFASTTGGVLRREPSAPSVEIMPARAGDVLSDRFDLRREIGRGAHGVVFEAFDREGAGRVALKVLRELLPQQRLRFKAEFRALTDVSHPNLVTLHELFATDAHAYFSMELVDGVDLMRWVRRSHGLDEGRLRDALAQLAHGLFALHGLGKLHRDLKPSNVLVRRRDGRVKLVDFGLVREAASAIDGSAIEGTPRYMSPEQASGRPVGPPSDWYAVGVMLYEALSGAPPFADLSGVALLGAKQIVDVAALPKANLPDDLHALCMALLARPAAARPDGDGVLRCLGHASSPRARARDPQFVGRVAQLAALESACARLAHDAVVVALVDGAAGSGKSALLHRFVRRLARRGDFIVLRARCYERESVPYKGIDALVDAMRHELDDATMAAIEGGAALVALFPVLADRVASGDATFAEDPVERRREAVAGLRRLLDHVADERALVLVIEDLQWCDHDSAGLLDALLRARGRQPILFVGSHRSDPGSAALGGLLDRLTAFDPVKMHVGALDVRQLADLAGAILHGRADAAALAEAIALQSAGNPLFALELARAAIDGSSWSTTAPRLEDVILERVRQLPRSARDLLQVVALAGRPIPLGIAFEAADIGGHDHDTLALLRNRSLLRTHGVRLVDPVEVFHDKIGDIVAGAIAVDVACHRHGRLAQALSRRGGDAEAIAFHLERAGRSHAAAAEYARAGAAASDALAFHRAAQLYASALRLSGAGHPERVRWLAARADALADGGRAAEAGRAYLDAMRLAPAEHQRQLRRRAAEQLLRAGHMADGLPELAIVLRQLGLRPPTSAIRAAIGIAIGRARAARRRAAITERVADSVAARELERIDACWVAATGLVQANVIVGQDFQTRHLLLALQAGEPYRLARALAVEALYAATAGDAGAANTRTLVRQVEALAQRLDDPHALALARLAAGAGELYRGRFVAARSLLAESEALLRTRCTDVAWELSMARTFLTMTRWYLGDLGPMLEGLQHAVADAEAREDFHTSLMLRVSYGPIARLVEGRLEAARAELATCRRDLAAHLQESTFRYVSVLTETRIERYAGDGPGAWAVVDRQHVGVWRSLMLWRAPFRTFYEHDRGSSAIAAAHAQTGRRRRQRLGTAQACVAALLRQGFVWATAFATPLRAALYAAAGDRDRAEHQILRAIEDFTALDMTLYAAASRVRLAELRGDPVARNAAELDLHDRGVADPPRMTALLTSPVVGW